MKKPVAHSFVLEQLLDSRLAESVRVKPMFGSHAIYVGDKIIFILRHREDKKSADDNGVWVVSALDQVEPLLKDFPALRRINMFKSKNGVPTWNNLPESTSSFEEDAVALCELVIKGDMRIGRVPNQKKPRVRKPKAKKPTAKKKKTSRR